MLSLVVGTVVRDNSLISRNEFIAPCVGQTSRNILLLCFFEGYVRTHVFQRRTVSPATWMPRTKYLPLPAQYDSCSLTNNDTLYTHKRLQGQVADGNCYASGGLCGHAGVFTTAPDVGRFMQYYIASVLQVDPETNVGF